MFNLQNFKIMKKLFYVIVLTVLAFGFSSCEQESINPTDGVTIESDQNTEGGDPDEDGGVKSGS